MGCSSAVVVLLFVFLLSSPSSSLHAARMLVPNDDDDEHASSRADAPCFKLQVVDEVHAPPTPAKGGAVGRHSRARALWSTPSDGVGH
ncbi:hypothetical protein GUJ93_ZPchr0009g863 [Zizania palustris]|uniref:Secreted protein n=1 Tax=Zizania palustris TaxID=103762 RepID=A0A8J5RHW8_ZIZPA|nr:hypothetical protein GUJ93_ZPchr0009g863 [Zizania palustris]